MKTNILLLTISVLSLVSCDFNKSMSQDLISGLSTKGDGLSCNDVYISDGNQELTKSTFTYGEKFYINFDNLLGFEKADGLVFPGMELLILNEKGEAVMRNDDLYASYKDGISLTPLQLQSNITAADPMHSGNNYMLKLRLWDKKGAGYFNTELSFDVQPNDNIIIEEKNISYNEIYLFAESGTTITDNVVNLNENIYLIFEGLEGFKEEAGESFIGLRIQAVDSGGEIIINEEDLIGESAMNSSDLKSQLAPNVIFKDNSIKSPVTCTFEIWDKRSEKGIKATTELILQGQ